MSDAKPNCAHHVCDSCGEEVTHGLRPALDLSRMTLGELEQTAERMGKAVATIREAQSLLGGAGVTAHAGRKQRPDDGFATRVSPSDDDEGPPPPRPEVAPDAVAAHRARQFQPPDIDVPRELQMPKRPRMSPAEQQQRAALLGQFSKPAADPNLPDDIAAMEQGESPR